MTEAPDPLEAELSALRPHEVSPGLRRRVAERLGDPSRIGRRTWRLALAGGLAAACLAAALFRWGGDHDTGPESMPVVVRPRPAPPVEVEAEVDDSEPTLVVYERALARSPEALNALLAKRASLAPDPRPELARIGAFTRSDADLRTLLGEN
jgi:hypothetical protein